MDKVIVFGPGMTNTLGLIRSLGEKGLCVHVVMQTRSRVWNCVGYSRYISKAHYIEKNEDFIQILYSEYWKEPKRIAILCGGDDSISFLDNHYDELKHHFLIFNCGEQGRLGFYLDKTNQFPIAKEAGLTLIKTWVIDNIHNIPSNITFPCLTKGRNSTESTKGDMHLCYSYDDLRSCINNHTRYLVQELIEKECELNIVCMSYNQGKDVFVPCVIKKIRDDIGRQSAYFKTDDICNYPGFNKSILESIALQLRYEGIFSVEVIYAKGKYYFLEINLRNDGCGYLYTKAGCNYPFLWQKYATGNLTSSDFDSIKVKIPSTMMGEHDLKNLFQQRVGIITWVRQFFCADAFYILDLRDPLPFFISTLSHIKQVLKRIIR